MNYFDHAASTPIYSEVLEVLAKSFKDDFANPNSQHLLGRSLLQKIDEARSYFLKELNVSADNLFIFTSSATESNNTIIHGLELQEGDVVLYSKADHPSLVDPIENLGLKKKIKLLEIPLTSEGIIDEIVLEKLLDENIKLVALTHVNNQSGVISNILKISTIIKEKTKAHIHVDAVQSFSKIAFDFSKCVDSISFTSHKIGGPKGIAGLYIKKGAKVHPLLLGGGQELGMRSSTQSLPLILAFQTAAKISLKQSEESFRKIESAHSSLAAGLLNAIPTIKIPFLNSSPYILTFILPDLPSDVVLRHLESRGFYLSSTSACSSKIKSKNPTFSALNIPEKFHKNVLRVSFSQATSLESVKLLELAFREVWDELKYLV